MMENSTTYFNIGTQIERFKLVKTLGSGATAEVWEAADHDNKKWALKIYSPSSGMQEEDLDVFRREYTLTSDIYHEGIIKGEDSGVFQNRPYIVFRLCDSSLSKQLHERLTARHTLKIKDTPIYSEEELAYIISDVASALNYLHRNFINHRDIKPDNILIKGHHSSRERYMISDFGVSVNLKRTLLHTNKGLTPDYASPEQFDGNDYPESDIFSFGLCLYELCTGTLPVKGMPTATALKNGGTLPDLPGHYSNRLNSIIQNCLNFDPKKRPTESQLSEWADFYISEGHWKEVSQVVDTDSAGFSVNKILIIFLIFLFMGGSYFVYNNFTGSNRNKYEIIKSSSSKFGIVNGDGILVVDTIYDGILPINDIDVITVSINGRCKWIDINNKELIPGKECSICKNYKTKSDFDKDSTRCN